ncbi:alpha-ribazole phosphatase [Methylotenera sp.]|uniref:alpha-ribazole phosphatase n=1 Tax=Methylotenera sp. TaxID=2051956 RepID=UPI002732610E|nr:alpha-ribazole phosphatase [Methylotenera sp.]MDP3309020.1 alpha-ribazole phosphatase [Methylotenera sp.]
MKLTLVRHTSLNIAPSICYGQSDVEVSDKFDDERQKLQIKLASFRFDAIYTSPLQRCHKLAQALCADERLGFTGADIQYDARLSELHFGDWEMSPWDAIPRETFDVWANDYANLAPPNGETFSQLHARAKSFVEDVSSHSQEKNLLVVTHGGLIRALIAEVLNMPLKRLFRITIDHASVTQLEFNGEVPKVNFMNL